MKRILSVGLLVFAAVAGNVWAQSPNDGTFFHAQLRAEGGLPFNVDLPWTGYDEESGTISFNDGTIFIDVSGLTDGALEIDLKVKNRPYRQSIQLSDKRLSGVDGEYYTLNFVADVKVGGITMSTPVSYTILKGSYMQVKKLNFDHLTFGPD